MGQYHKVFNLTKKQMLNPHRCGDGLKIREFGTSGGGTMCALAYLLGCSTGRGSGDFERGTLAGTWAGDRITILGDYAKTEDMVASGEEASRAVDAALVYDDKEGFEDVSDKVREQCPDIESAPWGSAG